ncbi:hypothetical protein HY989_05245 [Candidatus Micrarchaeota archaeon]|nr:hypothetical protein [Candidatus Micrarchaeota archaeon]
MLILILFLISAFLLGCAIVSRAKFLQTIIEKASASVLIGLSIATLIAFAFSLFLKSLSEIALIASVLANFLFSFAIFKMGKTDSPPKNRGNTKDEKSLQKSVLFGAKSHFLKIGWPEILVLIIFIVIAYFNSISIAQNETGDITAISNTWADYALHIGIINSFALRDNFPPVYPNLQGAQMRYPFLADFLSAIFVKEGISIVDSIVIPNLILIFCLVSISFAFLRRFVGDRGLAAIAMMLFFFNGNFGIVPFMNDWGSAGYNLDFLAHPPRVYSYMPVDSNNLQFMNLTYSVFIPQRSALLGFPIVMLCLLLLWRMQKNEAEQAEYLICALLLGILPLIHPSSFVIGTFFAAWTIAASVLRARKFENKWKLPLFIFLLIAIPQLLFINEQQRYEKFAGILLGWMSFAGLNPSLELFATFWLKNAGATLILGIAGLFLLKKDQRIFSMPFILFFIASNIFRFQPWDWDNVKVLMYWYFGLCIFSAIALGRIIEKFGKMRMRQIGIGFVALIVFLSIFSGLLTFISWNNSKAVLWSASDIKTANFISQNTPKDAKFVTAGKHNHIAYTLAGRQILAGYWGHLWSHGLKSDPQINDEKAVLASANKDLMKKWNMEYVFIGEVEIKEFGANARAFKESSDFEEIYYNQVSGDRIYKLISKN